MLFVTLCGWCKDSVRKTSSLPPGNRSGWGSGCTTVSSEPRLLAGLSALPHRPRQWGHSSYVLVLIKCCKGRSRVSPSSYGHQNCVRAKETPTLQWLQSCGVLQPTGALFFSGLISPTVTPPMPLLKVYLASKRKSEPWKHGSPKTTPQSPHLHETSSDFLWQRNNCFLPMS